MANATELPGLPSAALLELTRNEPGQTRTQFCPVIGKRRRMDGIRAVFPTHSPSPTPFPSQPQPEQSSKGPSQAPCSLPAPSRDFPSRERDGMWMGMGWKWRWKQNSGWLRGQDTNREGDRSGVGAGLARRAFHPTSPAAQVTLNAKAGARGQSFSSPIPSCQAVINGQEPRNCLYCQPGIVTCDS